MSTPFATTIYLCKNCPLVEGDCRTWDFDSQEDKLYALTSGLSLQFGDVSTFTNYSRLPTESGIVHSFRLAIAPFQDDGSNNLAFNYMAFENDSYSDASPTLFFAFIRNIAYVNDNTIEVSYVVDDFMTYENYLSITSAYVERMHEPDKLFGNLVAESDLPTFGTYTAPLPLPHDIFADDLTAKESYMLLLERGLAPTIAKYLEDDETNTYDGVYIYGVPSYLDGKVYDVTPYRDIQGNALQYDVVFVVETGSQSGSTQMGLFLNLLQANQKLAGVYSVSLLPTNSYQIIEFNRFERNGAKTRYIYRLLSSLDFANYTGNPEAVSTLTCDLTISRTSDIPYQYGALFSGSELYGVKNFKCLTSPFTKVVGIIDGEQVEFLPEKLLTPDSTFNFSCGFKKQFQFFPSQSSVTTPKDYVTKNVPPASKSRTIEYYPSQAIGIETVVSVPFSVDSYGEYAYTSKSANATLKSAKLTSSAINFSSSMVGTVGSSVVDFVKGDKVGGIANLITGPITAGLSYADSVQSVTAQFSAMEKRAANAIDRSVTGHAEGEANRLLRKNDLLCFSTLDFAELKLIDDFFSLYGYARNETISNPDWKGSRPYFNFFKATSISFGGCSLIPARAVLELKKRFQDGIMSIRTSKSAPRLAVFESPLGFAGVNIERTS